MLRDLISTGDATGDPDLIEQLVGLRGRLTRTIAAAVVDLDAQPSARWAHLTTNKPRSVTSPEAKVDADPRFELGSVTKGLTGMLLADAIGRGELTLETTAGEILAARPELHEQHPRAAAHDHAAGAVHPHLGAAPAAADSAAPPAGSCATRCSGWTPTAASRPSG